MEVHSCQENNEPINSNEKVAEEQEVRHSVFKYVGVVLIFNVSKWL